MVFFWPVEDGRRTASRWAVYEHFWHGRRRRRPVKRCGCLSRAWSCYTALPPGACVRVAPCINSNATPLAALCAALNARQHTPGAARHGRPQKGICGRLDPELPHCGRFQDKPDILGQARVLIALALIALRGILGAGPRNRCGALGLG